MEDAEEGFVSECDAKVFAQVGVNDGAKAGEFALILNDLEDGN